MPRDITPAMSEAAAYYKQLQRHARRLGYRTIVEMAEAEGATEKVFDSLLALHQNALMVIALSPRKLRSKK